MTRNTATNLFQLLSDIQALKRDLGSASPNKYPVQLKTWDKWFKEIERLESFLDNTLKTDPATSPEKVTTKQPPRGAALASLEKAAEKASEKSQEAS